MATPLEREIKLRFGSAEDARQAVARLGAARLRARRLQCDYLLDTAAGALKKRRSTLRVRIEPDGAALTFKGPPIASTMKLREELETPVADGRTALAILERAGFTLVFRYEKYREEFRHGNVVVAIDETPIGTFVELEGDAAGIETLAARLQCSPSDYITASYRSLFLENRSIAESSSEHMVFEHSS